MSKSTRFASEYAHYCINKLFQMQKIFSGEHACYSTLPAQREGCEKRARHWALHAHGRHTPHWFQKMHPRSHMNLSVNWSSICPPSFREYTLTSRKPMIEATSANHNHRVWICEWVWWGARRKKRARLMRGVAQNVSAHEVMWLIQRINVQRTLVFIVGCAIRTQADLS